MKGNRKVMGARGIKGDTSRLWGLGLDSSPRHHIYIYVSPWIFFFFLKGSYLVFFPINLNRALQK